MAEYPLLFNGAMVRAILSGAKTQTRRPVKPDTALMMGLGLVAHAARLCPDIPAAPIKVPVGACPHGEPGDHLYVRETWSAPHDCDHLKPREIPEGTRIHYRATEEAGGLLWRPSIHMPNWMKRLRLEVTGVRVERLQQISEADARAEGVQSDTDALKGLSHLRGSDAARAVPSRLRSARDAFRYLWEETYGAESWAASPWVWVIEFKKLEAPRG